jgi:hypothetical protein
MLRSLPSSSPGDFLDQFDGISADPAEGATPGAAPQPAGSGVDDPHNVPAPDLQALLNDPPIPYRSVIDDPSLPLHHIHSLGPLRKDRCLARPRVSRTLERSESGSGSLHRFD